MGAILSAIYLLDPDDINYSDKFNYKDKALIKKCAELLKHLYRMETGKELTIDYEVFNKFFIEDFKDTIAGRIIDSDKEYYEERLKGLYMTRFARVEIDYDKNFYQLCQESKNRNYLESPESAKNYGREINNKRISNKLKFD